MDMKRDFFLFNDMLNLDGYLKPNTVYTHAFF